VSFVLLAPWTPAAAKPTRLNLGFVVEVEKAARPETALEETAQVIARRLGDAGMPNAVVKPDGGHGLVAMIPRAEDPEQILRLVQTRGFLELRLVRFPRLGGMDREEILFHFKGQLPADLELLEGGAGGGDGKVTRKVFYAVERRPLITSTDVQTARLSRSQFNNPIVELRFTEDSAEVFGKATEANIGSPLAIVLDGKVVSAPVIRARIGQEGVIDGDFSEAEARELAIVLRSGPLPAPVELMLDLRGLPSPSKIRRVLFGGCAAGFLLFLAALVWLYRRSNPARRTPG